ncbi:MAG: PDR/VanB family oxidoreductase [Caenibius sp.]
MTGDKGFLARVSQIREESAGVKSFLLEPADGCPPTGLRTHVDLALAPGRIGNIHCVVIAAIAQACGSLYCANRRPGRVSVLHEQVKAGDALEVLAVRNNFPLVDAELYLLVAGGIGITPLLAMARELEAQGKHWRLLYGGRNRATMAFAEELATYGDKVNICPEDEFGLLDLAAFLGAAEPGKVVFCCGPEPLIKAVEAYCAAWPEEALQIERFHPKEQEPHGADTAFEVELKQSGKVVTVPPGRAIADVLEDVGVYIPRSCNEGTCGTLSDQGGGRHPRSSRSFLRPAST